MNAQSLELALGLAAVLFVIGLAGMIARRSLVFMLLCAEIMLNAAGFAFIIAGARWGRPEGQVMFIFLLVTAAAEVAVGLALILAFRRARQAQGPGRRRNTLGRSLVHGTDLARARAAPRRLRRPRLRPPAAAAGRRARSAAPPVGLSAVAACVVAWLIRLVADPAGTATYSTSLWPWLELGSASPAIAFSVDALSVVMILVVTIVGFLIHLFSIEHMAGEEGYHRFFAYMNLFVAFMLILVLADNFLLLYLGWEGVGLCSFLLIGFWYRDRRTATRRARPSSSRASATSPSSLGILMLARRPGQPRHRRGLAPRRGGLGPRLGHRRAGGRPAYCGGALGKSAQLPLQTWLPDAMAGPSPGQRSHPRGHHGHRRRLPGRPLQRVLRPGAAGA